MTFPLCGTATLNDPKVVRLVWEPPVWRCPIYRSTHVGTFHPWCLVEDLPPELLQDADFEPCRYKLLIDATEDGGALRLLQSLQLIPEGPAAAGITG